MAVNVAVAVVAKEALVKAESREMVASAQDANQERRKKQKSHASQRTDRTTTDRVMDVVMNETRLAQRESHVRNSVRVQNAQTASRNRSVVIAQQNAPPMSRRTNPQSRRAISPVPRPRVQSSLIAQVVVVAVVVVADGAAKKVKTPSCRLRAPLKRQMTARQHP